MLQRNLTKFFRYNDIVTVSYKGRRYLVDDALELQNTDIVISRLEDLLSQKRPRKNNRLIGVTLIGEIWTNRLAGWLAPFMSKRPSVIILACCVNIMVYFYILVSGFSWAERPLEGMDWVSTTLQIIAVMLIHEVGHCAAASKMGIRADRIGLGIHIIFPALFSSISMVRLLPPAGRINVILGGMFLQSLLLIIFGGHILLSEESGLIHAYFALQIMTIFNLLPIFRLDGRRALEVMVETNRSPNIRKLLAAGSVAGALLLMILITIQITNLYTSYINWSSNRDLNIFIYFIFNAILLLIGIYLAMRNSVALLAKRLSGHRASVK